MKIICACIFLLATIMIAQSSYCQTTFLEMAEELHVNHIDWSCGVAIIDLNGDNINEIVIVNNLGQNRLYIWSDSIYIDSGIAYNINETYYHHSIAIADIDKDSRPDLYITGDDNGHEGRYYVNEGHPPFVDMAEEYNLDDVIEMGSSFFQITPQAGLSGFCGGRLMVHEGDTFIDITDGSGLETITNVHCPIFFDIDGDYDDDLFVAGNHTSQIGRLFRNNGDSTFTDISHNTDEDGFPLCQGAAIGDIDNDGDFDLYLTFATGFNSMWENDGSGFFSNITLISNTGVEGFTRGVCFGDYDNDTDLDLFLNRAYDYNVLYINDGTGIFTDYSYEAGVTDLLNGIGCSAGDLNNDGQLDIVAVNCDFEPNQVYINQNFNSSFIRVKLLGNYFNSLALGSIIELYSITDEPTDTIFIGKREIQSHSGMFSVNEPVAHFGTGVHENLWVHVTFPSLEVVDVYNLSPGQTIVITEPPVSIDEHFVQQPSEYMCVEAYPNPFNDNLKLTFAKGVEDKYNLSIYDVLGRLIKSDTVFTSNSITGNFTWDGTDNNNRPVPSGVYLVHVQNSCYFASTKVTLLK